MTSSNARQGDEPLTVTECTILGAGDAELVMAGARVRAGHLVAFPTETVYGLGANAFDDAAASRVFAVKGRPATDPLIVHVTDVERGMAQLWDVSDGVVALARVLFAAFAPGPLTLVAKASARVAAGVTGGSGMVGIRVPAHPVARALIDAAGVPIAAPSANTFGHVSPTIAEHVYLDLAARDSQLVIIDGGRCSIGVESTVARIVVAADEDAAAGGTAVLGIEVLRRGAVSHDMIQAALRLSATSGPGPFASVAVTVKDTRTNAASGAKPMAAPGQLLTHYSPSVPAFLLDPRSSFAALAPDAAKAGAGSVALRYDGSGARTVALRDLVVIDWGDEIASRLAAVGVAVSDLRAYKTLSASRSSAAASREVFALLRWTEMVDGATAVALPLVAAMAGAGAAAASEAAASARSLLDAVEDRLFRAASGRVARFIAEEAGA
jgi:L-threonylcarbamoyladenylate synthase